MTSRTYRSMLLGLLAATGLALSGCDYWPPALQAQIEQLRSEVQTSNMEKEQLQSQLNDLAKAKQDVQAQVDTLDRMNREKTGMISSLQREVETLRAKAAKASVPKVRAKVPTKATAKPATKTPAKKKTPAKPTQKQ